MSEKKQAAARAYYQNLLEYRGRQIRFFALTRAQWASTLGLAILIAAVGGAVIALSTLEEAGWLLIGMALGTLARDVGLRRRSIAAWPWLDAALDWERVSEGAAEAPPTAS